MRSFDVTRHDCPKCNKRSYWPFSTFHKLSQDQSGSPMGDFSGLHLCEHCKHISMCKKSIDPPGVFDTRNPPQGELYERLFLEFLKCDDRTCAAHAPLIVPKTASTSISLCEALAWRLGDDATCDKQHPVKALLRLHSFLFISRPFLKCQCGELLRCAAPENVSLLDWPTSAWKERAICTKCGTEREFSGENSVVWCGEKIFIRD
jgi:hypothetical protein